jgi:hypothetical protein
VDSVFDAGSPNLTRDRVATRSYMISSFGWRLLAPQVGNGCVEILILGGWSRSRCCRTTSGGLHEVLWGGGIGSLSEE